MVKGITEDYKVGDRVYFWLTGYTEYQISSVRYGETLPEDARLIIRERYYFMLQLLIKSYENLVKDDSLYVYLGITTYKIEPPNVLRVPRKLLKHSHDSKGIVFNHTEESHEYIKRYINNVYTDVQICRYDTLRRKEDRDKYRLIIRELIKSMLSVSGNSKALYM